jgi:hypothetical protein
MEWPALAELARDAFPEDVIARAKELQSEIGSIGAYSHSQGIPFIRKNVARFIQGTFIVIALCCNSSLSHRIQSGRPEAPRFSLPQNQAWLEARAHTHLPSFLSQSEMAIRRTRTTFS